MLAQQQQLHTATIWRCPAPQGDESWEARAFAEDTSGELGATWPPRSYTCSFCGREFRSAQALGGHMNVHRRDRARLRRSPPQPPPTCPSPSTTTAVVLTAPELVAAAGGGGLCLFYPVAAPHNSVFAPAAAGSTSSIFSIAGGASGFAEASTSVQDGVSRCDNEMKDRAEEELDLELRLWW